MKAQHAVTVYSKHGSKGGTTQAKEERTLMVMFAAIVSHTLQHIQFLNSCGIRMGHFVKENKKMSK